MVKLDDCSILQHDHLVRSKPSLECMTCSAFKTQYLKALTIQESDSLATLIGHTTNEHLAWLDMSKT
jgi:hypothetical protein